MIHRETTLSHHLLEITVRKLAPAIPPNAQKNACRLEVTLLERGLMMLHKNVSGVMIG
jgi:hypothetical protein